MKTRDEVLVGLVVTAAVVVTILGSLWLARGGLSKGYPLYAKFPWGAGLKQGQPVLLVGVTVGYLDNVDLHQDGILVSTLRIQKHYQVPITSKATVIPNGIFGDMAVAIATALEREMVGTGGIRDLRNTIGSTNRLVNDFSAIANEQSRQLTATMQSVRRATTAIDPAKIDSTLANFRTTSANLAQLSAQVKETSQKLDAVLAKVDSGPGSAARLLNDPGAYNDVRGLLQRMDSLLADIKKNPKRYINVKIF